MFNPTTNRPTACPRFRQGQSMVEITLVLPLLLIMGLAVAEMGRLWQTYHAAKLAAEDGAYTATIHSNEAKGVAAIDSRLAKAKLKGGQGQVEAVFSQNNLILGYKATVDVEFKPFFQGFTLTIPGYGPISLFSATVPIHYDTVYSRQLM
ncbi:MAG: TadE/TadG family type IV pilus assembly protein [Vampirovibrionales bacterium]